MEQNPGAKNFVAQQRFSHEIVGTHEGALPREHVSGASSLVCTGLKMLSRID